jgi:hypothetical protein
MESTVKTTRQFRTLFFVFTTVVACHALAADGNKMVQTANTQ